MSGPASFHDVDAGRVAALVAMMDATDRWDAVRSARSWVLDRSATSGTLPVLDVGGGPGTFGRAARRAGHPTVDLDRSVAMVATARTRDETAPGVVADARDLPFPDLTMGLVHCERVLQWIDEPDAALAELWRVTAPGGLLAVTDTDWGTFAVEAPEPWMTGALADAALGWVPHPRLAATLTDRLHRLGASTVEQRVDRAVVDEWDPDHPAQADGPPGLPLHSIAAGASLDDRSRVADALATVEVAARRGRFRAELDLVTVLARR